MGTTGSESADVVDRLHAATAELRRERRRTADELEALRTFESRVRGLDPEPSRQPSPGTPTSLSEPDASTKLQRVREAYEATMMSVPHYIEEYDDSYPESLYEEFNAHVAVALVDGSVFNERCKRAVLSAVSESQSSRESLLAAIDTERESMAAATDTLSDAATELEQLSSRSFTRKSFGSLDAYRTRLGVIEEQCEAVSERRQAEVFEQRRAVWLPSRAPDIAQYFYQDIAIDYPAMSAVADLLEDIEDIRTDIERSMAFCHA